MWIIAPAARTVSRIWPEVFSLPPRRCASPLARWNATWDSGSLSVRASFCVSPALDGVDLTQLDDLALRKHQADGLCFVADSLTEIHQLLDPPALVLEDDRQCNIVEYRGRYYACGHSLGRVDVTLLDERAWPNTRPAGPCSSPTRWKRSRPPSTSSRTIIFCRGGY